MGFLSRIVADARAHAPMVSATARDVDRTQAAAEGWEIVEAGPPLSPPSPSPSGVELAATRPAAPPLAAAPRSAPHSAPGHDDRNAAPDPAARAPGDRPGLPVAPSSPPASPAAARAAMTASGAPSTPQPLASPRAPVSAEPARSRIDEAAARQVRAGVPDSAPPAHRNTRTRASISGRPRERPTTAAARRAKRRSRRSTPQRRQADAPSRRPRRQPALPRPRPRYWRRSRPPSREPRPPRGTTHSSPRHVSRFRRAHAPSSRAAPSGRAR